MKDGNCLSVKDKWGKVVVFTEKRRIEKAKKHPELRDLSENGFVKREIPEALLNPDKVLKDLTNRRFKNYYKLVRYVNMRGGRINFYTKVVVCIKWKPFQIITAYKCQNIKDEICTYSKN